MSTTPNISDRDAERIVAFLDGEMEEDQAYELAKRLAREPDLAAELEAFAEIDYAQRRASARGESRPSPGILYPWLPLAVAATALIALGTWWWFGGQAGPVPGERVALLAAGATLADYGRILEIEESEVPDEEVSRSGSGLTREELEAWEADRLRIRDFVRRVETAQRTRASAALEADRRELVARHFAISFEAPGDRAAVAVGIAPPDVSSRKARRLYPPRDPFDRDPPSVFPRFEGGKLHLLHGDPADRAEDGAGEMRRGFGVPLPLSGRMTGPRRMPVLLGLREAALTGELVVQLDEALAALDEELSAEPDAREVMVDRVEAWLEDRGFRVTRLLVEDPEAK